MTLRRVARTHAILLLLLAVGCMVVPVPLLSAFRIGVPSFATLALARVAGGVSAVLAAACWGLGDIPAGPAVVRTSLWLALAQALLTALLLLQEIAIWGSAAGAVLVGISAALAIGYLAAAMRARRPIEAIPEALRESQWSAPAVPHGAAAGQRTVDAKSVSSAPVSRRSGMAGEGQV